MKKYRIAQIGSFDVENYGDLLFAEVFEKKIKKYIQVEEIILFAPKKCKMPFYENRQVWSVTELEKMNLEKPFDAIVVGGGDLIHCSKIKTVMPHIGQEWVDYEALYMWMIPSIISWKYNIPLLWNAPGVPFKFMNSEKLIVKELCKLLGYISVRDRASKRNLVECGLTENIHVVPDTVFSISELVSQNELDEQFNEIDANLQKGKYIIFHANQTFVHTEMQGCIESLRKIKEENQLDILLLPIGYALGDEKFISELTKKCPGEFVTLEKKMKPIQMISLIENSAGYIGASLHGCITAASYGIPIVVCNYNRHIKIEGFLELVNVKDAVVYRTKDIYPVFQKKLCVSEEDRGNALEQIEHHFEKLASELDRKVEVQGFEVNLCEYVFSMRNMEIHYQEDYRRVQDENKKLIESDNEWQRKYQKAVECYQEILDSAVWKMTKPIRVLLNKRKIFSKSIRKQKEEE